MGELAPRGVLRVGDRIRFDGRTKQIVGLEGTALRLVGEEGDVSVLAAGHVMAADDFELLDRGPDAVPAVTLPPFALMDALPEAVVEQARFWERHVVEVVTGLPPDAEEGTPARPEYDPAWRTLVEREAAKVAELAAAGQQISRRTFLRMRQRYEAEGLWGLVDGRSRKPPAPVPGTGRVDERVVAAVTEALAGQTDLSTGDRKRVIMRTQQILVGRHGEDEVDLPKRATFYRLVNNLARGNDPFGSATVRRQRALRPAGPFTPSMATRPGEIVQVDSTRLDVMAVLDDGVVARPELTIAVDVTTRTICAALLRPAGTKGVDAAVLLAKMLVPEPMRPGWSRTLAMADSILPHERLVAVDRRLEHAAAKPVIVPDTIVIDHGKVFVSETFSSACSLLGISLQFARPRTPTDKAIVERTFASINSLFCQYVAGYTGSDVTRRGSDPATEALWTLAQLQDLLDEWIICWQHRPHEGLRNPYMPGRTLSPNESYAIAVARAGYLPVALSAEDYIELLPVVWRAVNDYGVKVDYRTYDSPELNRLRRQPSGVTAKQDLWEVHYDPYDVSRVWVRRSDTRRWIEAAWTHLPMVRAPFADFTWRHARQLLADQGQDDTSETAIARVLAKLLHRSGKAPAGSEQVMARTRAAFAATSRPELPPAPQTDIDGPEAADEEMPVTPFGVFNPLEEEGRPLW
ncbi:Mu transposase C-terminal domain-containing protein [Streptacidiphilus albus]|uniref:Mu transposase C-terminal domain-containing protein n=1 Tax=Streptacidiphilus albus TaxID=105425 RepID=UPI000B22CE12|nr:Mu transposase C-terminal domain-containing protein [Streptacidiphilus albus]